MYIVKTIDKITENALKNSSAKIIAGGSILFVTRSGILRRVLPIGLTKFEVTVNQDIKAFTSTEMDPKYTYYYALSVSEIIRKECAKDGTTVESIDTKKLYDFPISYPPLPEQHQIVAEIESRLSVADALEKEVDDALERVKGLRMGVLKRAFGGELVSAEELKALPND